MLNEEIKSRLEEKISLVEGTASTMGDIWKRHSDAHKAAYHAAGRLHTFLSARIHNHGITHEQLASDPDSHKAVFDKIHDNGVSMTMGERNALESHVNALKDAQNKREDATKEHDEHPKFKPSVGGAIVHGVFGKSKTTLSDALEKKRHASLNAMERHSEIDENSREAHQLRAKHGAEYDTSPASKKPTKHDDDEDDGFMKHMAKRTGNAILSAAMDTIRNPNTKRRYK